MPNPPLDALRKAQSISPAPPAESEWVRDALDTGVQGLLGTIGLGDDSSHANRGGQLLGAAMPFAGGIRKAISNEAHPAIRALMGLLEGEPSTMNPNKLINQTRATPRMIPPPPSLNVPEGFTIDSLAPPRPKTFQEASLAQEGFPGGFGRSPQNDALYNEQQASLKGLAKREGEKPQLSGRWWNGGINGKVTANTTVNADIVRQVRQIAGDSKYRDVSHILQKQFPDIPKHALQSIIKGDTFGWVK